MLRVKRSTALGVSRGGGSPVPPRRARAAPPHSKCQHGRAQVHQVCGQDRPRPPTGSCVHRLGLVPHRVSQRRLHHLPRMVRPLRRPNLERRVETARHGRSSLPLPASGRASSDSPAKDPRHGAEQADGLREHRQNRADGRNAPRQSARSIESRWRRVAFRVQRSTSPARSAGPRSGSATACRGWRSPFAPQRSESRVAYRWRRFRRHLAEAGRELI